MNKDIKTFERDSCKIIPENVLESLKSLIPDHSIDLIFANPPYNIGKDFNSPFSGVMTEERVDFVCSALREEMI